MKAKALIEQEEETYTKRELLDLLQPVTIWVADIALRDDEGTLYAARTEEVLTREVARFVRRMAEDRLLYSMDDAELIEAYFERNEDAATLDTQEVVLHGVPGDMVWIAYIDTSFGHQFLAGSSQKNVEAAVADWARENWRQDAPPPDDPKALIRAYFNSTGETWGTMITRLHD